MSPPAAGLSHSPTPSQGPPRYTSLAQIQTSFDAALASPSATPAPERAGSTSSAVSPAFEGPPPRSEDGASNKGEARASEADVRARIAADLEGVAAHARARALKRPRGEDEDEATLGAAARVTRRLAEDHLAVLCPDTETPFADAVDVVRRLLPYHVFQQPRAGLEAAIGGTRSRKGKGKATEQDLLREEIAETKFALECFRRRKALQDRFRRARIRSGKDASPEDQLYVLTQAVVENDRIENATLNAELKNARLELEKIQREQRAAAAAAAPSTPTTPAARTPTSSHYSSHTSSGYRPYSYYTPPSYSGTHAFSYNPYSATTPYTAGTTGYGTGGSGTGSVPTLKPAYPPATAPASSVPAAASPAGPSQTAAASQPAQQVQEAQSTGTPAGAPIASIPVQLPADSLETLKALGIVPVAEGAGHGARPAAVLKSRTETTVSLEINVQSLQQAQMNGLAVILKALSARGLGGDGSAANGVQSGDGGEGGGAGGGGPSGAAGASGQSSGEKGE